MSDKPQAREVTPPVRLLGAKRDDEGNRSPVKFFAPKGAPVTNPAPRPATTSGKKGSKGASAKATKSASTAEESSPEGKQRAPMPTQIPESDS